MIYLIHNVEDSCENIAGLNYRVISLEDSVEVEPLKIADCIEDIDKRMINLKVFIAKYDTLFHRESAVVECFDFIRKHAFSSGLNEFKIKINIP